MADVTLQRDQRQAEVAKLEQQLHWEEEKLEHLQDTKEKEIDQLNMSLRKANETIHKMIAELLAQNESTSESNNWKN